MRALSTRAFSLLGLLMTAECGLSSGGLGDDSFDAAGAGTDDGPSAEGSGATLPDAMDGRAEGGTASGFDGAAGGDAKSLPEGGVADVLTDGGNSVIDAATDADAALVADSGDATALVDSSGAESGASVEAAVEGGPAETGAPVDAGPACSTSIPAGWNLVLYDLGSNSCPANFAGHVVSGPPTVGASACTCGCSVTQDGSCTQGTLTVYGNYTLGGPCSLFVFSTAISGSGCIPSGTYVQTASHGQATPLPAQVGSCSSTSLSDATQVTTPSAHYCDVPAAGADAVCNGMPPAGFAACVVASGDNLACPTGTPFVNSRYVVEDSVTLGCSTCSCTPNTTCSGATLTAYSDSFCQNGPVASIPVDGTCHASGAPAAPPVYTAAIRYTATATTTCTAGASTASTQLTNPQTICCR